MIAEKEGNMGQAGEPSQLEMKGHGRWSLQETWLGLASHCHVGLWG